MESAERGRRQVDIFNFSFLDILACVIGLLIFILTIVVISGSPASNPAAKKQAENLRVSEEKLARARAHADMASDRKHAAQTLLASTSADLGDATFAKDVVIQQTSQFKSAAAAISSADAATNSKIAAIQSQNQSSANQALNEEIAAKTSEIDKLAHETTELNRSNEELAPKAKAEKKAITFYVPRLRETSRTPVFIEMTKKHFWFVDSEDFDKEPLSSKPGTVYTRKPTATGIETGRFVTTGKRFGTPFQSIDPGSTVLTFLVRPDSFDELRAIREWAWKAGYAVHWVPLLEDEKIILVPAHNSWQQ